MQLIAYTTEKRRAKTKGAFCNDTFKGTFVPSSSPVLSVLSSNSSPLFLFVIEPRPALWPPPMQWAMGVPTPGVKRLQRETNPSLPSSTEVNAWSYTYTPAMHLQTVVLS
jgi:hypothetical protein